MILLSRAKFNGIRRTFASQFCILAALLLHKLKIVAIRKLEIGLQEKEFSIEHHLRVIIVTETGFRARPPVIYTVLLMTNDWRVWCVICCGSTIGAAISIFFILLKFDRIGTPAAALSGCLSNIRAVEQNNPNLAASRLDESSCGKTSIHLVNRGPGRFMWNYILAFFGISSRVPSFWTVHLKIMRKLNCIKTPQRENHVHHILEELCIPIYGCIYTSYISTSKNIYSVVPL